MNNGHNAFASETSLMTHRRHGLRKIIAVQNDR